MATKRILVVDDDSYVRGATEEILIRKGYEVDTAADAAAALRQLEALILAVDAEKTLLISGTGDVIEPDDPVMAIGSGGNYALAAARALVKHSPSMSAAEIAREALMIAGTICLYTNAHISVEELAEAKSQ